MQINPAQSAIQNLLNLVDLANTGNAPNNPNQVTWSNLQAATDSADPTANTSVELTGVVSEGYSGNVTIYYGRLPLATEAESPTGNVTIPYGTTEAEALALVASYYGFILSEISWQTTPAAPTGGSGINTGTIQSSNSLVYQDGTATVNLNWDPGNTMMLLHLDNNVTDAAGNTIASSGTLSYTVGKFDLSLNMSDGAYLTLPSSVYAPGELFKEGNDFTLEYWAYLTAAPSAPNVGLVGIGESQPNATSCDWLFGPNNNLQLQLYSYQAPTGYRTTSTATISLNAWNHFAMVVNDGTITLYLNGVSVATSTAEYPSNSGACTIGGYDNSVFPGRIDEVRLSRIARYTANFTPPTAPFTLD